MLQRVVRPKTQIKIGTYAAIAGIVLMLFLPPLLYILGNYVAGTSIKAVLNEPEYIGGVLLYFTFAYVIHSPLFCFLGVFAYTLKRGRAKVVTILYSASLLWLALSAHHFWRYMDDYSWVRYVPAMLYAIVLVPLLSQGLLGALKKSQLEKEQP